MVNPESDKRTRPDTVPAVRVLVVEDEPLYAEQLELLLLQVGYEPVGPAATAQVALALHRSEPLDLALLDIGLRGATNGLQLAAALLEVNPVPIIFLTAYTDDDTFRQAQAIGPAAFLTKPFDPEALRRAMALAVANFAAHQWPGRTEAAASPAPSAAPDSVFIKENGLLEKIRLADIYSISADNKTCVLTLAERLMHVRMPLRELARYLPAERFVQIQRSHYVNVEHIERLDPTRHLVQVGKQVLPIGRLYLADLLRRLHTIT